MAFAYYKRERDFYGRPYAVAVVGREMVEKIVRHVAEYYTLTIPRVTFRGRCWCRCMWKEDRLSFTDKDSWDVGIVAHELAHYVESRLHGNRRHNAALFKFVGEILYLILGVFYPHIDTVQLRCD